MTDHAELTGKFRKKPIEIEAYCYNQKHENFRPDWFQDRVTDSTVITFPDYAIIKTLEGEMRADLGDWIIKGVKGELYPCKPDIFAATYEAADALEASAAPAVKVKALEAAIAAGNKLYNELGSRFDDAVYAAIRAYLAAAPESINAETLAALKSILYEDGDKPEVDRIKDRVRAAAIIARAESEGGA